MSFNVVIYLNMANKILTLITEPLGTPAVPLCLVCGRPGSFDFQHYKKWWKKKVYNSLQGIHSQKICVNVQD